MDIMKNGREALVLKLIREDAKYFARDGMREILALQISFNKGIACGLLMTNAIDEYQMENIRNVANAYLNGGAA